LSLASWAVFFLLLGISCEGGKLLVIPIDGSHWLSMLPVVEKLRDKGHEIVVLAPAVNLRIHSSPLYTLKTYPVSYTKDFVEAEFKQMGHRSFTPQPFLKKLSKIANFTSMFLDSCRRLLSEQELIRYLKGSQFDAVFMDPFFPCGQILAEHLSLPSIYFVRGLPCGLELSAAQCPSPPSYVPRSFTRSTDRMSFPWRLANLLATLASSMACSVLYAPYEPLIREFLQRQASVPELFGHAAIWLMKYDFVFEYPRPLMPNMVLVGGIGCTRENKLSQ
ncbi:UD11 glucuronosyltransferase, partial [Malurus elegans]|nr:UD11 glucuronosyltransferase [Malurus elegans]